MSRRVIFAWVFVLLSVIGRGESASPKLVNGLAGKVGEEYITVQDAYVFRSLQRYRTHEKPYVFFEKDQALKSTVQKVMFEKMLLAEAKAVDFKDPDPGKAQRFVKGHEALGSTSGFVGIAKEFDLSEAELLKGLQAGFLAEAFLRKKVSSLTPVVTSAEVDAYIARYPEKVRKLSGDIKSVIAEVIKRERADKALQDYIDFLTEKYSATFLLS